MLLLSFAGCRKGIADASKETKAHTRTDPGTSRKKTDTARDTQIAYPKAPLTGCFPAPLYGDSVIYPHPGHGADDIVRLANDPGPGRYFSWPGGLSLNAATGAINISKS